MKFDVKTIGYIKVFENTTNTRVKDCFFKDDELIFVVREGQIGKAIGKDGVNVKKLASKLNLRLRIIGFDKDPAKFIKNVLYPIKGYAIEKSEDILTLKTEDRVTKGKIYGRDRSNLKWMNELLKRYFKNIQVDIE